MSASSFFEPALYKGARLLRHNDTIESTHKIIQTILGNQRVTLKIQEMIDYRKQISETAVGKEHRKEFDEQAGKRLIQLRELQEMLNQTEADDEEVWQEIKQEILRLREELATLSRMLCIGSSREIMMDVLFSTALGAGVFPWVRT